MTAAADAVCTYLQQVHGLCGVISTMAVTSIAYRRDVAQMTAW